MIKKISALSLCVFLSFFISLFSQEKPVYHFNLETNLFLQTGTVDELVFEYGEQISKLVWQQFVTPGVNITYNASLNDALFKFQFQTAIPMQSGLMEDFDYLGADKDVVTLYSRHRLYVENSYFLKTHFGYDFEILPTYKLQPFLGITFQQRKFSGEDGYLQYPIPEGPVTEDTPKNELTGPAISYEQIILYPYVGLENVFLLESCILTLHASFFPYVYVDAMDNHYLRDPPIQFYDQMRGGYGLLVGTSFYMPFKQSSEYGLKVGFDYEFFEAYGITSTNNIGSKYSDFVVSQNASSGTRSNLYRLYIGFVINPNFLRK